MTAIRATFADFKLVRGRKVAQLVFEVPIEDADNALKSLGGVPRSDTEQWVAIAPLTREAAEKPRRSWSELSRAQQAGILCSEPGFWRFLGDSGFAHEVEGEDHAAEIIREHCAVGSRSQIDSSEEARRNWDTLVAEYRAGR